jgi:hypothetical protein
MLPRLFLLVAALGVSQQAPPPDPELFLCTLSVAGGKVLVGQPANISNNPGYDNQPAFTPDGSGILFTSVRGGRKPEPAVGAAIGSDIYRYDVGSGKVSQVTDTIESEFSPTVTPDGKHVSAIRVEVDGTQRLWRFTIDGQQPSLVLTDIKPVGYHAWATPTAVALFVLGQPATLQLADSGTGQALVIAKGIGRSLQRIPNGGISFVQRTTRPDGAAQLRVMELDPAARATRALVDVIDGATEADLAWTPDGVLLMANGGSLYAWRRGEPAMRPVADLAALGLRNVSRMAVSPKGDRIVFVAQR